MDTRLRLLLREYATSREPELAIRMAEELLRSGEAGPVTVYELEYEYLDGNRTDDRISCGLYISEKDAYNNLGRDIIERLDDYQQCGDTPDEILGPEIRQLIASSKFKEAAQLFALEYSDSYIVNERTIY